MSAKEIENYKKKSVDLQIRLNQEIKESKLARGSD